MVAMNPNTPAALEAPSVNLETDIMEMIKKIMDALTQRRKSMRGKWNPLNRSLNLVE